MTLEIGCLFLVSVIGGYGLGNFSYAFIEESFDRGLGVALERRFGRDGRGRGARTRTGAPAAPGSAAGGSAASRLLRRTCWPGAPGEGRRRADTEDRRRRHVRKCPSWTGVYGWPSIRRRSSRASLQLR